MVISLYIFLNPNPEKKLVGDCVVRAIAIATEKDWESVYIDLIVQGYSMHDMPSSNAVWISYLMDKGFTKHLIPDTCPACYTIEDFTRDFPHGTYIVATGSHVVAVIDGSFYDTWDSSNEAIIYYFER